jgi:hypothetical protein
MVISSILTIQLENIHAPIPSSRTRPRSVPVSSSKSPKRSPNRSHKERKQRPQRQIYIPDKPPFINFASAHINPYRYLPPITIKHDHHHRFKSRKRSKRKHKKQELSNDSINTETIKTELNSSFTQTTQNTDPIDLWPSDADSFDMDFIRKRQIAIDNTFYRETIRTWKPSSMNHVITLIKGLTAQKNTIDRVWIIYYWISQNIHYDIDADDNNQQHLQQKSEDLFRSRKLTSQGYATIFKTLCDHLGIKCTQIPGYAKNSHYQINQPTFSRPNHTWNSVQLDDKHWYLIDSVWGSGYINNRYEYKKDLKTFYFLTRPEHMIYNHFPEDSQWQLLAKPISILDYFRLPYIHSDYFIYDLTIISPRFSSMVIFDTIESLAEVLIQAPNDVQLACSVKDNIKSTSLSQYDASRQIWQCLFAPYRAGFYTLIIYANRSSTSNLLTNVIELGVEISSQDFLKRKILPITFGKFIEHKCQIFSPLDGVLKRGTTVIIHCRIPNATFARISIDGIWLDEVTIKDDIFKQQITVPEREIIVYAQFINKKSTNIYDGLVRYLVEK